jgi:REP element-mobilizing transposase RayT
LSLPDVVHRFKSYTTAQYRHGVYEHGWPPFPRRLWQRNYWEHIIRDDASLNRIREYIANDPARWELDQPHPDTPPNPFNVGKR